MRPAPTIAELLAGELHAGQEVERPSLPLAAPQQPIALDEPPRDREDQRPRELGDGFGEDAGRVRDDDPAGARRGDVDVVVADGDLTDDAQRRPRRVHQRAVDAIGQQADERIRAADAGAPFVGAGARRRDDDVAELAQHRHRRRRKRVEEVEARHR